MFGQLAEQDKSGSQQTELTDNIEKMKKWNKSNALTLAIFKTFGGDMIKSLIFNCGMTALGMLVPFTQIKFTNYIMEGDQNPEHTWESIMNGVFLAAILLSIRLLQNILCHHQHYIMHMSGFNAKQTL